MGWNIFSWEAHYKMAEEIFRLRPDVDGIFGSDLAALACLNVAQRKGIRVPEDLSIIGFDAMALSGMVYPELTAIRHLRTISCAKWQNSRIVLFWFIQVRKHSRKLSGAAQSGKLYPYSSLAVPQLPALSYLRIPIRNSPQLRANMTAPTPRPMTAIGTGMTLPSISRMSLTG